MMYNFLCDYGMTMYFLPILQTLVSFIMQVTECKCVVPMTRYNLLCEFVPTAIFAGPDSYSVYSSFNCTFPMQKLISKVESVHVNMFLVNKILVTWGSCPSIW